ncbi:SDR family NAD(P)-dependent oxidoreductase [Streptococcus troglodytae]
MKQQKEDNIWYLITISAKTEEALHANRKKLLAWFKTEGLQYNMQNIQYTFLIGRSHFQKRCAFVVRDQADIVNKLEELSRNKQVEGYYCSNDNEKVTEEREVGEKLLSRIEEKHKKGIEVEKEELLSLAELYVRGYDIVKEKISNGVKWRRVPVPTYVFSKEKYWIKENKNTKKETKGKLHPLVDCNCSTFEEEAFSKTFTGNEFFLRDHRLGREMVLPGVAYLEMVRVTAELARNDIEVISIENIVWLEPIQFQKDANNKVKLTLYPIKDEQNKARFIVTSSSEAGKERLHSQGEVTYGEKQLYGSDNYLDIQNVYERCNNRITKEECYRQFASRGLNLGNTFQSILEIQSIDDTEAISRICLPNELSNTKDMFLLHPSLLDGSLQTVISLTGTLDASEQELSLPYAIGKIRILRPFTARCYAHVTSSDIEDNAKDKVKKYNIDIVDENGNLLIQISNFSLKVLQTQQVSNEKYIEDLYYIPEWKEEIIQKKSTGIEKDKVILLFDNNTALREEMKNKGYKVILVMQGDAYREIALDQYEIGLDNENEYKTLMKSFKNRGIVPAHIIYNHGFYKAKLNIESKDNEVSGIIKSVLFLTKGLIQKYSNIKIKFLYLYEKSQKTKMVAEATGALLKTICRENPSYRFSSLGLSKNLTLCEKVEIVNNEFGEMQSASLEVVYDKEKRYCKTLIETKLAENDNGEYLRDNGVYIITGGMGALGQKIVSSFMRKKNVKLYLLGRTKKNKAIETRIDELCTNGGEIKYLSVDLSNSESVKACIRIIKEQISTINGVVYCAGINQDAMIQNKTSKQIDSVLKAKVYGVMNLDRALKAEPLDFFCMFSSIAAIFGNPGQADYAFANGYMNGYACFRNSLVDNGERFGKTCSINWPLWKNGGITVGEEIRKYFENTIGIQTLEDNIAMQMFEKCMRNMKEIVLIIRGERQQFKNIMSMIFPYDQKEDIENNNNIDVSIIIKDALCDLLQKLLKVKKKDIHLKTKLSEYGFNSLTFTEFANILNSEYDLNLTPALFFEHSTLESLKNYLYNNYKEKFSEKIKESKKVEINNDVVKKKKFTFNRLKNIEQEVEPQKKEITQEDEIAIVGVSGIFPKSDDLDELWDNLVDGKDLVSEIPQDRWDWKKYIVNSSTSEEMLCTKWGGFMNDIKGFDSSFFGIVAREAEKMDPQQKLFLETVWNTIEDAGYKPSDFLGSKTGVYVGVATSDYNEVLRDNCEEIDSYTSTGLSHCILVNRVSYLLNLKGPSIPIDTACSSSLIAIHQAVQGIRNGDCDMAIAGGVNVISSPMLHVSFGKAGMLSEDGSCKSFDKDANGYVRGEGVGAILLKNLRQAKKDKDHIYAVIKATAVNHGGYANTLTTPNPKAQTEVLVNAYEKANVDPTTISYIETHGTGTKLGDPIEINALKNAFGILCSKWNKKVKTCHCGLGTIKSNMGHLEAAAGIASTIKVLLAMKNAKIPANLHFNQLNPYIELQKSPFYIVDKNMVWNNHFDESGNKIPKRSGISSFGFGGVNAHIVLEEYMEEEQEENLKNEVIIVLSAKNNYMLKKYAEKINYFITNKTNHSISDVLTEQLLEIVADLLKVDVKDVGKNIKFQEYGVDYACLADIREKVNQLFKIDVNLSNVLQSNSIIELSTHLYNDFEDNIKEYYKQSSKIGEISLRNFAYTLQIGREEYKYRIAFTAKSFDDVKRALTQYTTNTDFGKNIHYGVVEMHTEDDNQEEVGILKETNPENIINLWIKGKEIDWSSLYSEHKPKRIALPPYPFDNQYYWFDRFKKKQKTAYKESATGIMEWEPIEEKSKLATSIEMNAKNYNGNEVTLDIVNDEIAIVTMCDIENRNMFSNQLVYGLISKFNAINNNSNIKVVIITGSNGIFSMGGTQEQLSGIANKTNKFSDIPFLYRGLLECKVPVIAAIQGHASGGGMLFGLYADIIIMSEEGIYSASFTKYGFTPGMGATCILRERFGVSFSTEMMFTAKSYKGSELRNRGASVLFTKKEEVLNEALSLAFILCEKPRETLITLKEELASKILEQLPNVIKREETMHRKTFVQPEVKKRIEKYYKNNKVEDNNKNEEEIKLEITSIDELLRAISEGKISPEEAVQYHF